MPIIDIEEDEFDKKHFEINRNFQSLENLYNSEVINLEMYYQIKGNIIQKLISISKDEIESIKDLP